MGCLNSKTQLTQVRLSAKIPSCVLRSLNPLSFLLKFKGPLSSDYTEIKTLGSGAFAEVKLFLHTPTNEYRAVKSIYKSKLYQDQLDFSSQLKEISIITSLDHPNILHCYSIYEDTQRFYVVTEYCAGGELFEKIIKWKRFTEEQAALIFYQLMSAVAYCHERNVIHRDLKPENILLEEKEESLNIKVVDFGSSCFFDPNKTLQNVFGTAYYVAPEVLSGAYTEKCDVWSCGVILYLLLTGRSPYPGKDNPTILKNVRTAPLKIDPNKHPELSEESLHLLQQMLKVDFNERISATEVLLHPWVQNSRKFVKYSIGLERTLKNLAKFTSASKLKDAVYTYIAFQILSYEELKKLKQDFQTLDSNGDGKISRDELMEQYLKTMSYDEAIKTVDLVMREVNTNENAVIDYHEFLKACMDHKKNVSRENLEKAFKLFDVDGCGEITLQDIKRLLEDGEEGSESAWQQMILEADEDHDGKIDFKEFIKKFDVTDS